MTSKNIFKIVIVYKFINQIDKCKEQPSLKNYLYFILRLKILFSLNADILLQISYFLLHN